MRPLVVEFLRKELNLTNVQDLVVPMMVILHSHRYKKQEEFLLGLDFTIIRNLVQSYSQEAREEFMMNP